MKSTTNRPASRAGNRAVAGKHANSTSIAAVEGPLSGLIGEKGTELKTVRRLDSCRSFSICLSDTRFAPAKETTSAGEGLIDGGGRPALHNNVREGLPLIQVEFKLSVWVIAMRCRAMARSASPPSRPA
jgi:hypothetical protein